MSEEKRAGFVMMTDISGSMSSAIELVKIDSKAFIRCARENDQFGINAFSTTASWVYPSGEDPNPKTVSADLHETAEAERAIEQLTIKNTTNISEAITLANSMMDKLTAENKAYIILSDGAHNVGSIQPDEVLREEPPLYIAGIGSSFRESYYTKMLAKNHRSRLYYTPDAHDMAEMFVEINADAKDQYAQLAITDEYRPPNGSFVYDFLITEDVTQLVLFWSDGNCKYTEGYPQNNLFNVFLHSPNGKTDIKPTIAGNGYCIFNLKNLELGNWKVVVHYSVEKAIYGTIGVISDLKFKTEIKAKNKITSGESFDLGVSIVDESGNGISGFKVIAQVSRPIYNVEKILSQSTALLESISNESSDISVQTLLRDYILEHDCIDIFAREITNHYLSTSEKGKYSLLLEDLTISGLYAIKINAEGIDAKTGRKVSFVKSHVLTVKD